MNDPNQNRTQVAYSPLGLVTKTAVMGKVGETRGDTLADPGTTFDYDFNAFDDTGSPISVTTTQRVYHINDSDIPSGADPNETIVSVEYSDGFGRVVQSRSQAEDLDFGDAGRGTRFNTLFGRSLRERADPFVEFARRSPPGTPAPFSLASTR